MKYKVPETELSQNNLKIYFRDEEVFNIRVYFNLGPEFEWDGKQRWSRHYTTVRAWYNCDGLQLVGTAKEGEFDGQLYIPTTSIKTLAVDYLEGHKFEQS